MTDAGVATRTVAIVDDEPIPRSGLEHLAAELAGVTIAASVGSFEELDADARYDVVILHLPIGEHSRSLHTISQVARIGRPLVISSWDRPPNLLAAVRAGARGCVLRQSAPGATACALTIVASGGFYLCEPLADRFRMELNRPAGGDRHGLAPREVETLRLLAHGLTHSEIARRMGLTRATVNTYAKRIRGKLKVSNRSELTRIAIELGELPVELRSAA